MDKLGISNRLLAAKLKFQADAYRDEVRRRLAKEQGGMKRDKQAVNDASWDEMWDVFKPAVENYEKTKKQKKEPTTQVAGLPDRSTNDILDPEYSEKDPGKQLRDGLIWVALEFDRVVEDTKNGPAVHLEDASTPPPNAFAINILRTYALSTTEKRRDLIGRALAFAAKSHDPVEPDENSEGAFLHEIL